MCLNIDPKGNGIEFESESNLIHVARRLRSNRPTAPSNKILDKVGRS